MIRIIDETPDPQVTKLVVCPNCGVRLEYTPSATFERVKRDYAGDSNTYRLLACLKCQHEIILSVL